MFKSKFSVLAAVTAAVCISCNKHESSLQDTPQEMSFSLCSDGVDFSVGTKTAAVTSVSSVYWEARSGNTVIHQVDSYSVSGGKVNTGKYWPSDSATYSYYVSNVSFTTSSGYISAVNTIDIVAGDASGISRNSTASVSLIHIFARTGSLTFTPKTGYTASNVSWKISSSSSGTGTQGIYILGSGWRTSGATPLSSTMLSGSSDLYLIPGTYSVDISYTLTRGAYSESFSRTGTVTLEQGKVNNISAYVGDDPATEIVFSVTVADWGTVNKTVTF